MGLIRLWMGILGLFLLMVFHPIVAEAHYLWVETSEPEAQSSSVHVKVFYGEFEESLRETAAGRLKEVQPLEAWLDDGKQAGGTVRFEKKEDAFEGILKVPDEGKNSLLQTQELDRPVQDWRKYDLGIVKPKFYASAVVLSPRKATGKELALALPVKKTILGIYPARLGREIELHLFFQDKVLSGAKAFVHAPNGWSKELKTDDTGTVRFSPRWPGQYVFETIRLERTPGKFRDVPYEAVRHRATFAWKVEEASVSP